MQASPGRMLEFCPFVHIVLLVHTEIAPPVELTWAPPCEALPATIMFDEPPAPVTPPSPKTDVEVTAPAPPVAEFDPPTVESTPNEPGGAVLMESAPQAGEIIPNPAAPAIATIRVMGEF